MLFYPEGHWKVGALSLASFGSLEKARPKSATSRKALTESACPLYAPCSMLSSGHVIRPQQINKPLDSMGHCRHSMLLSEFEADIRPSKLLIFVPAGCGSNQWYHFGVGAPPIFVYFSGDWDVHRGYWILTHGQLSLRFGP